MCSLPGWKILKCCLRNLKLRQAMLCFREWNTVSLVGEEAFCSPLKTQSKPTSLRNPARLEKELDWWVDVCKPIWHYPIKERKNATQPQVARSHLFLGVFLTFRLIHRGQKASLPPLCCKFFQWCRAVEIFCSEAELVYLVDSPYLVLDGRDRLLKLSSVWISPQRHEGAVSHIIF